MKNGSLPPALCCGNNRREYFFRPQDVEALLKRLARGARKVSAVPAGLVAITDRRNRRGATMAESVRKILDGRLQVQAVAEGVHGLNAFFFDPSEMTQAVADKEELSFNVAAARMRLNSRSLRNAVDNGLIKGVPRGAKTMPAKVADRFANRFIMLSEIRDRLGGDFLNLRKQLKKAGFRPDRNLQTCACAAYLRSKLVPFVQLVEAGDAVLGKGEASWKALVRETKAILTRADAPVSSEKLAEAVRLKMTLGPSDNIEFLHTKLWMARQDIVSIKGAGWWLRARPYLGITLPADGPVPTQMEIVDDFVLKLMAVAHKPLPQETILAHLEKRAVSVPSAHGDIFLRSLASRHAAKVIKLTGLGYWDRTRPYKPALYDPKTWRGKTQTLAQRVGLWIMDLLTEAGRPLTRFELGPMLLERGVLSGGCIRAYIREAVSEFPDQIIFCTGPATGWRESRGRRRGIGHGFGKPQRDGVGSTVRSRAAASPSRQKAPPASRRREASWKGKIAP
jgi:hypothetical protein